MTSAWIKANWAWLAVTAIAAATVVILRLEGRIWFCKCNEILFWIAGAYSPHTSQHLLDPYSFTHVEHGVIFYWLLVWLAPRASWSWRVVLAAAIEALWEVVENSPIVIQRYRDATAALGYEGDSVVNVMGDLAACLLGVWLAARLGLGRSIALLVVVELALLLWIRDNLLLNVVMLFVPIEAIKQWQTGG